MGFSDKQTKDILELKEQLLVQLNEHQKRVEELEKNIQTLDDILKQSSFTRASQLISEPAKEILEKSTIINEDDIDSYEPKDESQIPIVRNSDGTHIGDATISPDQVSITLDDSITIDAETPPLKSFFVNRIIGEMKKKDDIDAENGKIEKDSIIDCIINKNGGSLREIIIKNYRQKERVDEIINTATWSLTRMIENTK